MSLSYAANRAEDSTPPTNRTPGEAQQGSIEALAAAIERVGMSGVAPVLLRAFKPAAWAGGQLLWMLQPFFGGARTGSTTGVAGLASFLEHEENIEALIERLDGAAGRGA
jgi:hypothetical protein